MDPLTFVERLVHHLVWPFVILVLAGIFRHQIREVTLRISRLKFRGADLTFAREREELEDVRRNLHAPKVRIADFDVTSTGRALPPGNPPKETIQPVNAEATSGPQTFDDSLSPRLIVEQSWLRLELGLRDLEYRAGGVTSKSFRGLLASLVRRELLTPELETAIEQLRSTRNQLLRTHGQIPKGIVADFVKAADQIQLSLQNQAIL